MNRVGRKKQHTSGAAPNPEPPPVVAEGQAKKRGRPPNKGRSEWPAEVDAKLVELWNSGALARDILRELAHLGKAISASTLSHHAIWILKLKPRLIKFSRRGAGINWRDPKIRKKFLAAWARDASYPQIGRIFGVSAAACSQARRRYGLPPRTHGFHKPRVTAARMMRVLLLFGRLPSDRLRKEAGLDGREFKRTMGYLIEISAVEEIDGLWRLTNQAPIDHKLRKGLGIHGGAAQWNNEKNEIFRRMWAEGRSVAELAEFFNMSTESISRQRQRLGLPAATRRQPSQEGGASHA